MNKSQQATAYTIAEPNPWQFSIRSTLELIGVAAIIFVTWTSFPQEMGKALAIFPPRAPWVLPILMTPVVVLLLLAVSTSLWALSHVTLGQRYLRIGIAKDLDRTRRRNRVMRMLGLRHSQDHPSLMTGFAIALLTITILVFLWPALRELGVFCVLSTHWGVREVWDWAQRALPGSLGVFDHWKRLWIWELWSLGRWCALFGIIASLWLLLAMPFQNSPRKHWVAQFFARLMAFAPWLIVLEVSFLFGVWARGRNTIPEPSTGFVVGIFHWDLWNWDCWRDPEWLARGGIPTLLVGYFFFRTILLWWRIPSTLGAILLVPAAICLSVATTVAYQNGLP